MLLQFIELWNVKLSDELLSLLFADVLPFTVVRGTIRKISVRFKWETLLENTEGEEHQAGTSTSTSPKKEPFEIDVHGVHLELKFLPPSKWDEKAKRMAEYAKKYKQRFLSDYFKKKPNQIQALLIKMKRYMRLTVHEANVVILDDCYSQ